MMTRLHSTARFSFNRKAIPALQAAEAASMIANGLANEWVFLDQAAGLFHYKNPAITAAADAAYANYLTFVNAYMDDAYHVPAGDDASVCKEITR